jgi:hypothetical protein
MLSSAHILAMDTKNLLDVCDSIRQRYPNVSFDLPAQNNNSPGVDQNACLPQPHQSPKRMPLQQQIHLQQQQQQQEFYENVPKMQAQVNEQLYCNQNAPSEIGIYDNNSIIQQEQQLRIVEEPILSPNGTNGVEAQ